MGEKIGWKNRFCASSKEAEKVLLATARGSKSDKAEASEDKPKIQPARLEACTLRKQWDEKRGWWRNKNDAALVPVEIAVRLSALRKWDYVRAERQHDSI